MNKKVVFFFIGLVLLIALGAFLKYGSDGFRKGEIYPFEKWAETLQGSWEYKVTEKTEAFKRIDKGRISFKPDGNFRLDIRTEAFSNSHQKDFMDRMAYGKYNSKPDLDYGGYIDGKWGLYGLGRDSLEIKPTFRDLDPHGYCTDCDLTEETVLKHLFLVNPALMAGDYEFYEFNSKKIAFRERDYAHDGYIYYTLKRK